MSSGWCPAKPAGGIISLGWGSDERPRWWSPTRPDDGYTLSSVLDKSPTSVRSLHQMETKRVMNLIPSRRFLFNFSCNLNFLSSSVDRRDAVPVGRVGVVRVAGVVVFALVGRRRHGSRSAGSRARLRLIAAHPRCQQMRHEALRRAALERLAQQRVAVHVEQQLLLLFLVEHLSLVVVVLVLRVALPVLVGRERRPVLLLDGRHHRCGRRRDRNGRIGRRRHGSCAFPRRVHRGRPALR